MKKVILIFWLITISISSYKIYETYLFSHDNASFSSMYIEPIPKEIVFLDSGRTGTMEPFRFHHVKLSREDFDSVLNAHSYKKVTVPDKSLDLKNIEDEEKAYDIEFNDYKYKNIVSMYKGFNRIFDGRMPFNVNELNQYELYYRTDTSKSIYLIVNQEHTELLTLYH